jgi:hypothetical protein
MRIDFAIDKPCSYEGLTVWLREASPEEMHEQALVDKVGAGGRQV